MAKKIIHLPSIGAPCVGKGATKKALRELLGNRLHSVSLGHTIRERFSTDPHFRNKYEKSVNEGDLLPDPVAIPLTEKAYAHGLKSGAEYFYWDGCFRTPAQVHTVTSKEILTPENTVCLVFDASQSTILERHGHRVEKKTDGHRSDEMSLSRRIDIYNENLQAILHAFGQVGIRTHIINANLDLDFLTRKLVEYIEAIDRRGDHYYPSFPPDLQLSTRRRLELVNARHEFKMNELNALGEAVWSNYATA